MRLFNNSSGIDILISGTTISPVQYADFESGMLATQVVRNIPVIGFYSNYHYEIFSQYNRVPYSYIYDLGFQPKFIISIHPFRNQDWYRLQGYSGYAPTVIFKTVFMPAHSYFVIRNYFSSVSDIAAGGEFYFGEDSGYNRARLFAIHASGVIMGRTLFQSSGNYFIAWR